MLTLPLVGHFVLEPSTCQRTSLYQLQNTEDPSLCLSEVEPLPGLGRVGANNSAREAIRVRETFSAFFSTEGVVPWQHNI